MRSSNRAVVVLVCIVAALLRVGLPPPSRSPSSSSSSSSSSSLFVSAFPNGVPIQACVSNMRNAIPPFAHLIDTNVFNVTALPQADGLTGGFVYTVNATTWKANQPITLTINDTLSTGIRGFYYQAFDSSFNRVGTWQYNASLGQAQIISCPNGNAIGHTVQVGNAKRANRPRLLTFTLTIPTPGIGPIQLAGITLTDRVVWYPVNITILPELEPANTTVLPKPAAPAPKVITTDQVVQHNSTASCWTIYNGNVYDQTYWSEYHPGGPDIACGKDGSQLYTAGSSLHDPTRIGLYTGYLGALAGPSILTPSIVSQHNSSSSCWIIVGAGVYDVTYWAGQGHPVGPDRIYEECGQDATAAYADVKSHVQTNLATNTIVVGTLNNYLASSIVTLTPAYIAQQNSATSCWLIIDQDVYDMTSFANWHPATSVYILPWCGSNGTVAYYAQPEHEASQLPLFTKWLGKVGQTISVTAMQSAAPAASAPNLALGKVLTTSLVAEHNSSASCWVIIGSNVYDMTWWAYSHPVGPQRIWNECGMNATDAFYIVPAHVPDEIGDDTLLIGAIGQTIAPTTTSLDWATISLQNTPQSCWLVLNNNVYDVTDFAPYHPAGASYIYPYCGTNATVPYYAQIADHNPDALPQKTRFLGTVGQTFTTTSAVAAVGPTTSAPTAGPTTSTLIPLSQVAQHGTTSDCWVVYFGNVYDQTNFIPLHPGGPATIAAVCGSDGSTAYTSAPADHVPSQLPIKLRLLGVVGTPATTSAPTASVATTATATTAPAGATVQVTLSTSFLKAAHSSASSCWISISAVVYDMTGYAGSHPGGADQITGACGSDATSAYNSQTTHIPANLPVYTTFIGQLGATITVNAQTGLPVTTSAPTSAAATTSSSSLSGTDIGLIVAVVILGVFAVAVIVFASVRFVGQKKQTQATQNQQIKSNTSV